MGHDAFEAAIDVVKVARERGVPLRLLGGQAIRFLCPEFPHRARNDQDMDFAAVSSAKREVIAFLRDLGFVGDDRFNTLHGDRQMYFQTPDGATSVDVIVDRLNMCHVLDFAERIDNMPYTLDVTDLLLSKLQIVQQNEKDVHDIGHLLAGFPVVEGDAPEAISCARLATILGEDWGWWRTATGSLRSVADHLRGDLARLVPTERRFEPIEQAERLLAFAEATPKSLKWKVRARVGERVQWYELPEEVGH